MRVSYSHSKTQETEAFCVASAPRNFSGLHVYATTAPTTYARALHCPFIASRHCVQYTLAGLCAHTIRLLDYLLVQGLDSQRGRLYARKVSFTPSALHAIPMSLIHIFFYWLSKELPLFRGGRHAYKSQTSQYLRQWLFFFLFSRIMVVEQWESLIGSQKPTFLFDHLCLICPLTSRLSCEL